MKSPAIALAFIAICAFSTAAQARYYDPVTGRFISEDPKGFAAGQNFYAYANNNPIDHNDPSGMDPGDTYMETKPTTITAHNVIVDNANLLGQRIFGATGTGYVHATMEINADPTYGYRRIVESLPNGGVQITPFDNFMARTIVDGASVNRYAPITPLSASQLSSATQIAENLSNPNSPTHPGYDFNVLYGGRDTSRSTYSCMELCNTIANQAFGYNIINRSGASSAVLPSNISNSATYQSAPLDWSRDFSGIDNSSGAGAAGGYLIYPNKPNNNQLMNVYRK